MVSLVSALLIGALAAGPAAAMDLDVEPGAVLEGRPGWTESGVGAPAVVWVEHPGIYVMFFESRIEAPSADCPQGRWAIGTASSRDGERWQVASEPLISPRPDSFYSCGAAHPSAVFDGRRLHVWFKAEQETDACDDGARSWGCTQQSGVGYAWMPNRTGRGPSRLGEEPALVVPWFGYPDVVRDGDTWHMYIAKVPDIVHATAPSPDGPWVREWPSALRPGFAEWAEDRAYNPTVTVDDDGFQMLVGGKSLQTRYGGIGLASSSDGASWTVDPEPIFDWDLGDGWHHWDAVRLVDGGWRAWFSEIDASGRSWIGMAETSSAAVEEGGGRVSR